MASDVQRSEAEETADRYATASAVLGVATWVWAVVLSGAYRNPALWLQFLRDGHGPWLRFGMPTFLSVAGLGCAALAVLWLPGKRPAVGPFLCGIFFVIFALNATRYLH